ncbi:hypothetical protein BDQ17DRAFT_187910 [Cyathus striatus]|nr:hypothetical protein BDQ17DRAFT_187910 [Cyathus striatus]
MATLQGDAVDAVTADLYPISKDDTPISAADIINGVSVPELLKLTKNEITDVVPSLDTPDVSRTDSFDEESGVLSKVDTAAPSFELTETLLASTRKLNKYRNLRSQVLLRMMIKKRVKSIIPSHTVTPCPLKSPLSEWVKRNKSMIPFSMKTTIMLLMPLSFP